MVEREVCVRLGKLKWSAKVTLWVLVWTPGIPGAVNMVTQLLAHFLGRGSTGPTTPTPAPPGSPSASLSLSLIASSAKDLRWQDQGKWKTELCPHGSSVSFHVLVCLDSPLLWVQAFSPTDDLQWLRPPPNRRAAAWPKFLHQLPQLPDAYSL